MAKQKFTRRGLLHRLGGSAAIAGLSPLMPLLETDAEAATIGNSPMRYLYWYTPVVPFKKYMDPLLPDKSTVGQDLQFRNEFSALNEMSHKMSYIRGLTNTLSQATGNVGIGGGHRAPGFPSLSGWAPGNLQPGDTPLVAGSAVGMRGKSTLDYWLLEKMKQKHNIERPIERLAMGHRNFAHNDDASWRSISCKKGALQFNHQSPAALYEQMFKFAGSGNTQAVADEFTDGYKRNVLDSALTSLNQLRQKLSPSDKLRLEQHLEAIREAERQLDLAEAAASGGAIGGGSCQEPDNLRLDLEVPMDKAIEAYIQLLTIAFSCDLSRVGGMYMLSHIGDNTNDDKFLNYKYSKKAFHFLPEAANINNGNGQDYHHITHITGETAASDDLVNYLMGGMRWRAEIFTQLLKSLDSVSDANGKSILDNSIIHWFTENSHTHAHYDQFHVIAGGADYFKMGKHLNAGKIDDQRHPEYPQTMLLKSIASAFGFDPAEGLVEPEFDAGDINQVVLL